MYEFTTKENLTLSQAAHWARVLGAINVLTGITQLSNGFAGLVNMAIYLVIGMALWNGGGALKRVVDTQGDDISHMMDAMTNLARVFTIRLAMIALGLVLACAAVLIGVVTGASS
jgi:hypothetical protein